MNSHDNNETGKPPVRIARWVWLVVAAQALFLLTWAGYHEYVRTHGSTVWLKTEPVDPRDLLRGDYMILNYKISRHSQPGRGQWRDNTPEVCVALKPDPDDPKFHIIDEVFPYPPGRDDSRPWVYARARIREAGSDVHFEISYDMEKYFVPEGKGTPDFQTIEVEAAISRYHRLQIKRLWLDGKIYP